MTESEDILSTVRAILARALQLGAKSTDLQRETALLGNLPEIDSMAVVHVLAAIEDHFGVAIADDEVSADTFATLGTLADFVEAKILPGAD